jgi:hypothetical protein
MNCAVLLVVVCLGCTQFVNAARCHGDSKPGPPNLHPIDNSAPVLNKTVENGKLFTVGSGEDAVDLLHLYGTPYEMGFAHGKLLKDKLLAFYPQVETYLAQQVSKKAARNPVYKWVLEVWLALPSRQPHVNPTQQSLPPSKSDAFCHRGRDRCGA